MGTILVVITSLILVCTIFISLLSFLFYPKDFSYDINISPVLKTFVTNKYPEIKKLYAYTSRWNHETKYINYKVCIEIEPSKRDSYYDYLQDNVLDGNQVSDFENLDVSTPFTIDVNNSTVSFQYNQEIEYNAQYPDIIKDVIMYSRVEVFIKICIYVLVLIFGIHLIKIKE